MPISATAPMAISTHSGWNGSPDPSLKHAGQACPTHPERNIASRIPDAPEAFLALVEPWEGPLYRHCYRLMGHPRDAEDLCQEALLRAYQYRHRYDPAYRFSTWLFTLATRLCLSEIRRRQVRPLFGASELPETAELCSSAPTPRAEAEVREAERLLVAALGQLPPKYRAPVSLFYEQELSVAEIADILGITPNLVKVRLFRGRERLAELLRPCLEPS